MAKDLKYFLNLNAGTKGYRINLYDSGKTDQDGKIFGDLVCQRMGFGKTVEFIGRRDNYTDFMNRNHYKIPDFLQLGEVLIN